MHLQHKVTTNGIEDTRVRLTLKSGNTKVGPIPVSTTTEATCPDACPMKAKGCYAKSGPLALVWRGVTEGTHGNNWAGFVAQIASLPSGQLWRHNQAGDLPGVNNTLDRKALATLVSANKGKRGFTYTHKPLTTARDRDAIRRANARGFTVNLSADNLREADSLADLGIAPVVVILDAESGVRHDVTTPAGRTVATCPATYRDDITCASCQLCQRVERKVIVGFPAHGTGAKTVRAIAKGIQP